MTLERQGCCSKWLGCFLCCECCKNEMFMHVGEFNGPIGSTKPGSGNYLGRSVTPLDGPFFTPNVDITTTASGVEQRFGVVEGPTCFAGWKGLCCGDKFTISSANGRSGDLGLIQKREARG